MSDQLHIEELFKRKLEGLEETPSAQVWKKTARTVRRKQFMRFHPDRLNIFYAAGLVVVGGLLAVLLTEDRIAPAGNDGPLVDSIQADSTLAPTPSENPDLKESPNEQDSTRKITQPINDSSIFENLITPEADIEIALKEQTATESPIETIRTLVTYFTPSVSEGCVPLTVQFNNASINAVSYEWSTAGDVLFESQQSLEVIFSEPGTYTVSLVTRDAGGLARSHAEQITVHPQPKAQFEIADGIIYNYSIGAVEYLWEIKSPSRSKVSEAFQVDLEGLLPKGDSLLLTATNIYGCTATAVKALPVPKSPTLLFPTAFRPNPDGATGGYYHPNEPSNQVFYPKYDEKPSTYNLKIFNKTGELIFETDEIEAGWDGYYKDSPAPRGVYIFQCTGSWRNSESFTIQGDITLYRD
jgi:gliding motility-associated-like protein